MSQKQDAIEKLNLVENELGRCKQERDKAKIKTKQLDKTIEALKDQLKANEANIETAKARAQEDADRQKEEMNKLQSQISDLTHMQAQASEKSEKELAKLSKDVRDREKRIKALEDELQFANAKV
jgi:chromosome segregation ATPase